MTHKEIYNLIFSTWTKHHTLWCRHPNSPILPSIGWFDAYNMYTLRDLTDATESRMFKALTMDFNKLLIADKLKKS